MEGVLLIPLLIASPALLSPLRREGHLVKNDMADWPDIATAVRYYEREGFSVGKACCDKCRHSWTAILEDIRAKNHLECPKCHELKARLLFEYKRCS